MSNVPRDLDRNREPFAARADFCERITLPRHGVQPVANGDGVEVESAVEAYKSLRTRVMRIRESRGIGSVAITSAAHSDGKTLTSFNLACSCAHLPDLEILLVDADLRTAGLTHLIGAQCTYGLRDALGGNVSFGGAIVATDLPNLCFLAAGMGEESPAEIFAGRAWAEFMEWATASFGLVLIDAPPVGVVADFSLIESACHGTLVVVRAHRTVGRVLEQGMEQLDSKKLIGVVWNEADPKPEGYGYDYYKA